MEETSNLSGIDVWRSMFTVGNSLYTIRQAFVDLVYLPFVYCPVPSETIRLFVMEYHHQDALRQFLAYSFDGDEVYQVGLSFRQPKPQSQGMS